MTSVPQARSRGLGLAVLLGALGVAVLGTGCSLDGLLKSDQLPRDVQDPAITQTAAGALAAYQGAVVTFRRGLGDYNSKSFVAMTGLLSDELQGTGWWLDQRALPEGTGTPYESNETYGRLQRVRGQAGQAIGLLTRYAPDERALVGQAYTLEGYAEVFLAELFCSGIPLSTLDFDGDYTYRPGSSTAAVLTHALALFDTALTLGGDSARFGPLAQVGRARALVGLGAYAQAAAAATTVPDGYQYALSFRAGTGSLNTSDTRDANFAYDPTLGSWPYTVADREGGTGLDYRTSGDPRTTVTQRGTYNSGQPNAFTVWHPNKYADNGSTSLVLASGVEARLIEAEAALAAGDAAAWLTKLNALRTDGSYDTTATSPPDTLWHAGSGGVAGLRPLADPGTPTGRVDLLFRERAFWLFLTGHRQGDLRRLIRQYGRPQSQVYPVGNYPWWVGQSYGSDVTAPIPQAEQTSNPLFTGCASRGA